jgi:hypothetical protein
MPLTWDGLDEPFRRADSAALTTLLLEATEQERLGFAAEVELRIRGAAAEWSTRSYSPAGLFALTVIACVSTPARAATLLNRRGMRDWREISTGDFLRIVRARRLPWAGDLGVRLARVLSSRDVWGDDWRFVEALLIEGDAEPPVTEGVVRGWVQAVLRQAWSVSLADALRGSPWLDLLLPSVFEIDGLGSELPSADFGDHDLSFPEAVARLAAEGRLDRRMIVDATADRLARGDRPAALRPFALLHEALAPAPDELSRHTAGYARLAGDAPSPVARIALSALRTLGQHDLLEIDTVVDAGRGVLARKEKVLVKAGLTWLDETARRSPERAGEILETVATAFDHQSLDIQERAFAVAGRHRAHASDDVAARLAASVSGLPASAAGLSGAPPGSPEAALGSAAGVAAALPGHAASSAGDPPAAPSVLPPGRAVAAEMPPGRPVAAEMPPGRPIAAEMPPGRPIAAEMPPPIGSAAELAEEVSALVRDPAAVRWERVLAALVSLPQAGFAESLGPVLDRHPGVFGERWGRLPFLGEVIAARLGRERSHVMRERLRHTVKRSLTGVTGGMDRSLVSTPSGVLTLRVAEAAVQLKDSARPLPDLAARPVETAGPGPEAAWRASIPVLLATPTEVTGTVDAGVLVERLARYEDAGVDPWPLDLQQAMIRMSRSADAGVLARADALASPPGKLVAGWLRSGGLPDPVSAPFEQCSRDQDGRVVTRRVVVTLESGRASGDRIILEDALVNLTPRARPEYHVVTNFQPDVLAMVLPQHREVVAAWALTDLAALADQDGRDASLLPLLADAAGPAGPATVLALLYGLAARYETDRVAAVDAFLSLTADPGPSAVASPASLAAAGPELGADRSKPGASGGEAFAAALGDALGDLAADGTIKLARAVPALRDAHQAGASGAVWLVLRHALPLLLPAVPRGLPDLLELATRTAAAVGARDAVPGLPEMAGRGGGTRVVREAKRLQATLTH